MKRYKLENAEKKTIIGTIEELEGLGFKRANVRNCACHKCKLNKEWVVTVIENQEKTVTKVNGIDEIACAAMAAGMTYGQYVARNRL